MEHGPLGAKTGRRAVGRYVLAGAALLISACSPDRSTDLGAGPLSEVTPEGMSLDAPKADLLQRPVTGTSVEPVSGLPMVLAQGAAALAPESLGDGRTAVTYVWSDPQDWGYLVVEGPVAFDAAQATGAATAGHEEQQALIAAGIRPTAPASIAWEGFVQAVVLAWNQTTIPPGWVNSTSVDAIELLLANEAGQAYRLIAYGGRERLGPTHPAWQTLCGIGADRARGGAEASPSPSASETSPADTEASPLPSGVEPSAGS